MIRYDAVLIIDTSLNLTAVQDRSLVGRIHRDNKGRWRDGTLITTSAVVKLMQTPSGVFAYTRNSIYKVVVI